MFDLTNVIKTRTSREKIIKQKMAPITYGLSTLIMINGKFSEDNSTKWKCFIIFFLFSHFVTNLPLEKSGESRDLHPEFQMSCDKIQLKCFVRTYPQSSH